MLTSGIGPHHLVVLVPEEVAVPHVAGPGEVVVGKNVGSNGNRFWPGLTPPVGISCGAQRAMMRVTISGVARTVSFQPVS